MGSWKVVALAASVTALAGIALAAGTFNAVHGWISLGAFVSTKGIGLWDSLISACNQVEAGTTTPITTGIDCAGNIIFYLVGATTSYVAGGYGAEYIANGGGTPFGKRDDGHPARAWNWSAIHGEDDVVHNLLTAKFPGTPLHVIYNDTMRGLDGGVITAVKESETAYHVHSTNTTHGVTAHITKNGTANGTKRYLDARQEYYWYFDLPGVKFSYAWTGCIGRGDWLDNTLWDSWLGQCTNDIAGQFSDFPANSYGLGMTDLDGNPYVTGYLVVESNPFGYNYEGAPAPGGCVD